MAPSIHITASTGKGILIGLLSAFGSAAVIAVVFLLIWVLKFTQRGRIFLDRLGRPGEYDDEQAFLREEAEAMDEMGDLERSEYLRAKGMFVCRWLWEYPNIRHCSFRPGQSSRINTNRHLTITIPRHTRKRRLSMGIRARARNSELLRRSTDGNRVLRLGMLCAIESAYTETE